MNFEQIEWIMRKEFPGSNLNMAALETGWGNFIRPTFKRFRVKYTLPAEIAAAVVRARGSEGEAQSGSVDPRGERPDVSQHTQGSSQDVHALSYEASRPHPGASYEASPTVHGGSHRVPQPGYGDQHSAPQPGSYSTTYGGPQSGSHRQYVSPQSGSNASFGGSYSGYDGHYTAPHQGFRNPYLNAAGTNQPLAPAAYSYSSSADYPLPPIASGGQIPTNQRPPPLEPPPMSNQNYGTSVLQGAARGMQEPRTRYRTGHSGSSGQGPRGGSVSEQEAFDEQYQFSKKEKTYILKWGMGMTCDSDEVRKFYDGFKEEFRGRRLPSQARVLDQFEYMRTYRQ